MKNQIAKSSQNINYDKIIINLQQIIQKTILSAQKYKLLDIFGPNELNICITSLESLFAALQTIDTNGEDIANKINNVKSELIIIFKNLIYTFNHLNHTDWSMI